ncbi:bacteriophage abortive infection AbiH family protein [Paludibacter jiangxiensis]|uniref:Bacteriophage abortive infection AbiH n=1 Tax=Paludibacter jiangxiensis TaxID=681398 RepID=A0A161LD10_9BACT|nr:bacteriophage abortive infection AbiH family protein [Paludibacter jiangxiensis]GAT61677.1 bacteriophage abortive infection AbiH [Paludibacter jiangxiensis]
MKLYIIGNGFDLYHHLPSSYSDFREFIKETDPFSFEIIEEYFNYTGAFWHAFEINLTELDEFRLIGDVLHSLGSGGWDADALESYEPLLESYTIGMFYQLKTHMINWIKILNNRPLSRKYPDIDPDSLFISFNYTNTLERHFHIHPDQINYIHGSAQEENCNLIFGHDMNKANINYDVDDNQEGQGRLVVQSFLKHTRKPVEKIIAQNQDFWSKLYSLNEVIIIGHSLSPVDAPYFKTIANHVPNKCLWKVSYYNKTDIKHHTSRLIKCGVDPQFILPFDIYPDRPTQGVLF